MALGDGLNDVAMLRWAGCGWSMQNAEDPAVTAAADEEAAHHDEDGVGQVRWGSPQILRERLTNVSLQCVLVRREIRTLWREKDSEYSIFCRREKNRWQPENQNSRRCWRRCWQPRQTLPSKGAGAARGGGGAPNRRHVHGGRRSSFRLGIDVG